MPIPPAKISSKCNHLNTRCLLCFIERKDKNDHTKNGCKESYQACCIRKRSPCSTRIMHQVETDKMINTHIPTSRVNEHRLSKNLGNAIEKKTIQSTQRANIAPLRARLYLLVAVSVTSNNVSLPMLEPQCIQSLPTHERNARKHQDKQDLHPNHGSSSSEDIYLLSMGLPR